MSDYIPPELIPNILAKLPVDDVLRCTSVCKSWYALITSPSFTSLHLKLSSSDQEPHLLVGYCKTGNGILTYCLRRENQTFDEIAVLDPPCSEDSGWEIIDCFNGLFCLNDFSGRIILWNPSIRKSFLLPNSRGVSSYHNVGFAYIPASKEYKIVRFSFACKTEPRAEIYQLSTGSWRDIKFEDYSYARVYFTQAHLNGILHWHARKSKNTNLTFSNLICTFNMKTEKFGALMFPSCLPYYDDRASFVPFTFRETLCLIDDNHSKFCDVWVMKEYGEADSWEKLFVIDKEQHGLNYFGYLRNNGELLFGKAYKPSTRKTELVSYDCNTNEVKYEQLFKNVQWSLFEDDNRTVFSIHTYVESLVLIKSPNEVKIDKELRFDAESNV